MDEIILTQEDNGSTISLNLGDSLNIILSENATTGYTWEVLGNLPLQLRKTSSEQKKTYKGSAGGSGKRVMVYTVENNGAGTLTLKYWQPWSGESSIEKQFIVHFEVS